MSENKDHLNRLVVLTPFAPSEYRLWEAQTRTTFDVHNLTDIVLGKEPDPTPSVNPEAENDEPIIVLTPNQRKAIADWDRRHKLAKQSLLSCLQGPELMKVFQLKLASEVWSRLADEYGKTSDIKHGQAEFEFHSLQKGSTPLEEHINRFIKLQHEVNLNSPPGVPPMTETLANLAFLRSLGDEWSDFQRSIGPRAYTMKPGELFAEVRAEDSKNPSKESKSSAKAYTTQFQHDGGRGRGGYRGRYRGHRGRGGCGRGRKYNGGQRNNNYGGGRIQRPTEKDVDMSLHCSFCKEFGHPYNDCKKRIWWETQKIDKSENNGNRRPPDNQSSNDVVPYQWPGQSSNLPNRITKVTYFAASISVASPNQWIFDSASNTNLIPFKERLENYVEYSTQEVVKGLGGSPLYAQGHGSVTLVDECGKQYTLRNVLFVPDAEGSIMSMMQVRRQGLDFRFVDDGGFTLRAENGFLLKGSAVDDILYISDYYKAGYPCSFAVITRYSAMKRQFEELPDEKNDEVDEDSHPRPITNAIPIITSPTLSPNLLEPCFIKPICPRVSGQRLSLPLHTYGIAFLVKQSTILHHMSVTSAKFLTFKISNLLVVSSTLMYPKSDALNNRSSFLARTKVALSNTFHLQRINIGIFNAKYSMYPMILHLERPNSQRQRTSMNLQLFLQSNRRRRQSLILLLPSFTT